MVEVCENRALARKRLVINNGQCGRGLVVTLSLQRRLLVGLYPVGAKPFASFPIGAFTLIFEIFRVYDLGERVDQVGQVHDLLDQVCILSLSALWKHITHPTVRSFGQNHNLTRNSFVGVFWFCEGVSGHP